MWGQFVNLELNCSELPLLCHDYQLTHWLLTAKDDWTANLECWMWLVPTKLVARIFLSMKGFGISNKWLIGMEVQECNVTNAHVHALMFDHMSWPHIYHSYKYLSLVANTTINTEQWRANGSVTNDISLLHNPKSMPVKCMDGIWSGIDCAAEGTHCMTTDGGGSTLVHRHCAPNTMEMLVSPTNTIASSNDSCTL